MQNYSAKCTLSQESQPAMQLELMPIIFYKRNDILHTPSYIG